MSTGMTRDQILLVLQRRGFTSVDKRARKYAQSWRAGSELVNVKNHDANPLVIHPRHEPRLATLEAISGVLAGERPYCHNSGFSGFDKRVNKGKSEIFFGIDFGFESTTSLEAFLDTLTIEGKPEERIYFDADAQAFLDGFMAPDNPQFVHWLPLYVQTLVHVRDTLARNAPEDLFETIWKSRDNAVSNAGQGVMGFLTADRLRGELVEVIRDIAADGSPANFDVMMNRLERWRAEGRLPSVPRLLLARAFAAIHPERYHTTVDAVKQERVIQWFAKHTGLVAPEGNWAARAEALCAHLDRADVFGNDLERRNMFPWFVFGQMRDASGKFQFRPGHTSKPATGMAHGSAEEREIDHRHNVMQDRLVSILITRHGEEAVATEHATGTGGFADALVKHTDGRFDLYEIKPANTAASAVRQAMGQLLEYAYRRGGLEPASLHVVSDASLDEATSVFLSRLESEFGLPIHYLQVPSEMEAT